MKNEGQKKCFYEVLGVESTAETSEIRKAYHKLALKCHPDKNGNTVEANEIFQSIQSAYEVLSDKNERQWYDDHRTQILGGGDEGEEGNIVNLWSYFSTSIFDGFSDSQGGFYAVYHDVFEQVFAVERQYDASLTNFPTFGNSKTSYKDVQSFYQFWSGFLTNVNFSWCDEYRIPDAPNRQVRRVMEKENKKHRDSAKKNYNSEVRTLVDFVRKRDPRVIQHIQRTNQEKEEKKKAALIEKADKEREFSHKMKLFKEKQKKEWLENDIQDMDAPMNYADALVNEEVERVKRRLEQDVFRCEICNKVFKSEKQVVNHEQSKKHRDRVAIVRKEMEIDDVLHGQDCEEGVPTDTIQPKINSPMPTNYSEKKVDDHDEQGISEIIQKCEDIQLSMDDNCKDKEEERMGEKLKAEEEKEKRLKKQDAAREKRLERKIKRKEKKSNIVGNETTGSQVDHAHRCAECDEVFESRNRLFKHMKKERHETSIARVKS